MLAPDAISTEMQQRTITLPKNRELWSAVNGALSAILTADAWEDSDNVTAQDVEQIMQGMFSAYVTSTTDV